MQSSLEYAKRDWTTSIENYQSLVSVDTSHNATAKEITLRNNATVVLDIVGVLIQRLVMRSKALEGTSGCPDLKALNAVRVL